MPTDSTEGRRATNWLAIDLAELAFELGIGRKSDEDAADFHFDVTIVGSGYGGAMVLNELAGYSENGQPLRIAMLERGSEYLPGAFPSRMSYLAGHVRFNTYGQSAVRGREAGLFDVRVGPDVGMLLASGLGGGSLINAGVMQAPLPSIFQDTRWPSAIRNDKTLGQQLEDVKTICSSGLEAALHPLMTKGRHVRVLGGPLHGLEGYVDDPVNPRGIVVSVDVLQQGLLVRLPLEHLQILP